MTALIYTPEWYAAPAKSCVSPKDNRNRTGLTDTITSEAYKDSKFWFEISMKAFPNILP